MRGEANPDFHCPCPCLSLLSSQRNNNRFEWKFVMRLFYIHLHLPSYFVSLFCLENWEKDQ